MPQDELWCTSARTTGFSIDFYSAESMLREKGMLVIRPTWSKRPSGRDGAVTMEVPSYALWSLPDVFKAGFDAWLGGDPVAVSHVVRASLRDVLHGYQEGARG